MMFFKKKPQKYELVNFSMMNVSTGQIGQYILDELYDELRFYNIGYTYNKIGGELRCILYMNTEPSTKVKNYFKDRCPAMIEEKVRSYKGVAHSHIPWENGYDIVGKYKE